MIAKQNLFIDTLTLTSPQTSVSTADVIFSQDDLFTIRTYAEEALRLPSRLPAVQAHLGFARSRISGLEPEDVLTLYNAVRAHARRWTPIEAQIDQAASQLNRFAEQLISLGDQIINCIDALTLDTQMSTAVSTVTVAPLHPDSRPPLIELSKYLEELGFDIRQYDREATVLAGDIQTFSLSLQTELTPAVQRKIRLIKDNDIAGQLEVLNADIERLRQNISTLKRSKPRRPMRRYGGDLSQAQTLQKRREHLNNLTHLKDAKVREQHRTASLKNALTALQTRLANTASRMNTAHHSVSTLQAQWRSVAHAINQSASDLKEVNSTQDLFDFVYYFSSVINPWRRVISNLRTVQERQPLRSSSPLADVSRHGAREVS